MQSKSLVFSFALLAVSSAAFGETLALYPFKDGAAGASAADTTLVNAADSAKYAGTVSAATYEHATGKVAVYVDHKQVVDDRIEQGQIAFSGTSGASYNTFRVGKGANGHPFPGWVDEVRFSRSVLPISRFLKLTREPSGLMLLFR